MKPYCIAFLAILLFKVTAVCADEGFITGDVVNVRSSASISAPVVGLLHYKDKVTVMEVGRWDEIGTLGGNRWYRIEAGELKGWVFGRYMTQNVCRGTSQEIQGWAQLVSQGGATSLYQIAFFSAHEAPWHMDVEASSIVFSNSCGFFATDYGSDIIGTISIYANRNRKAILHATYDRAPLIWVSDCITFHEIDHIGDGCTLWSEKQFCGGKIVRTGKEGKSPFHGATAVPDPKCNR